MQIANISRRILRYYFNYHYYDMPSELIVTAFTRRLQFALRMVVAFLVSGFLAYYTPLNTQSSLQYLIPVQSVLVIQETFGMTLLISYQMLMAIVPLSIFLYIVHVIGLGYKDYLAAELLLLITSLVIGYKCSQVWISQKNGTVVIEQSYMIKLYFLGSNQKTCSTDQCSLFRLSC